MNPVILFLNDTGRDPTKRLKLAGVRRYAAATGWNVIPIPQEKSSSKSLAGLLERYRPVGCICDEDSTPTRATPRLFGDVPVVFANGYGSLYGGPAGRICVDNAAVARAAFRELSAGNPEAFAVVGESSSPEWSVVRIKSFQAEVAKTGHPCHIIRENRWKVAREFTAYIRPWIEALPRHTAIYAVNDPIARRIADAANAAKLRIPQDLTLLGTDNTPTWCEAPSPTISSIQLDFERMGYLAAKMLGQKICQHGPDGGGGAVSASIGPMLAVRRESTGGRGRMEPHILEAVEIIRREACNGLTVAKLAARLPGSRRLLDLRFREAMGHSVLDEIQQVRLERVFDLLRQPGIRIGAIADFSGFALHQLDKVFRSRFGCSLRDWRKRNA
jgi:LacI family transcriptional regulator